MRLARIIWFTGLSGSGKTTLAYGMDIHLKNKGLNSIIIDGDTVRDKDKKKSFEKKDIIENNERIIEHCKNFQMDYDYLLVSVIAPFNQTRQKARKTFAKNYFEVYVKASLEEVIKRDTKGLYKKSLSGKLKNMIGLEPNIPYEEPFAPELVIYTDSETPQLSLKKLIEFFDNEGSENG